MTRTAATARTSSPIIRPSSFGALSLETIVSLRKCAFLVIAAMALAGCGGHSNDPRQNFAKSVVDALAAANWDRSALITFLCSDRPKDSVAKGISFDLYQDYGAVATKSRLIPIKHETF